MVTTLVLLVAAWAAMVPLVLALARLLGRMSSPVEAVGPVGAEPDVAENVVALVPRPRNRLDATARSAA